MLELSEPEGLLVMYGEYHHLAQDGIGVLGMQRQVEVSLPPPVMGSGAHEQ